MTIVSLPALAVICTLAAAAIAQPRITVTTVGNDLSADGSTVCGWMYDGTLRSYAPYVWRRGVGFQRIPGKAPGSGGTLACSADGTILASAMDNTTNWEGLNCFAGYTAGGVALPPLANCSVRAITHRYTSAGWVNAGSLARTIDPGTGRWIGGTACDATINSSNDISGNGRVVVGGAYSAVPFNSMGNPSFGFCGDFFAFRYDSLTGEFLKLPTQSHTTRADRVNADGSVVVGYDLGLISDPGGSYPARRLCVWTDGVQTILDSGGNQDSAPVNGPGTVVVAGASPAFCLANFGVNRSRLVKWTRSGSAWTPVNLGRPADRITPETILQFSTIYATGVSDDGNTVVGNAKYGNVFRPFIWRPTINGGVPVDLADYLALIDPNGATQTPGLTISSIRGLSADGNTLLIGCEDGRSGCVAPNMTLVTFFSGVLTLDPAGQANEPPTIAMGPVDEETRCTWAGWGSVFNVSAGGSWPLNYQWQREDPANPGQWLDLVNGCSGLPEMQFPHDTSWEYEGVNKAQLRVNVIDGGSHDGRYRVVVSNAHGSVTSEPARLTFLGPINPLMPVAAHGCANSPAVFTVGSVPGGVEYRWEVCTDVSNGAWAILAEGVNTFATLGGTFTATGTRTGTLTVNPGTLPAGGTYNFRCHIADSCNSLETDEATLTVGSPCGPADVGGQGGLPAQCGDGTLDNNDFIVFIDHFFDGDAVADQGSQGGEPGPDGFFDNNDFVVFITHFFDGCN